MGMTQPLFALDPRLAADTAPVAEWPLCQILLIRDARFVWLVLVPKRAGASEILDLSPGDRTALSAEIDRAAAGLRRAAPCDKLNIAALGNVVAQLHVHVIARRKTDAAWPKPVWGLPNPEAYDDAELGDLIRRLNAAFPS
jgi:diadenosine tetraphosphate (Ap4A) HIT family hydrolase